MQDARILPFLGVSFGSCGRGEGRGGARGTGAAHAARARPPLCARRRGAFAGSSHAALSCPRSRARCSCCCACSRVRRARCPPLLREARTFRGALCEVSAFASRRWVCLSPFTRRLSLCVRSAAARVVELVSASHEGDTHGSVAASVLRAKRRHRRWATSRLRAASSRPRLRRPVHITAETAGLCRLPSKTWRCDGVSLNCCCSVVLF